MARVSASRRFPHNVAMSLILEALKKSEAERRAGELPVVLSERVYVPPRERPVWPVFAVFVLLVGLAGGYVNRSILWPERFPPPAEEPGVADQSEALPEGSVAVHAAPVQTPAVVNSASPSTTTPTLSVPATTVTEPVTQSAVVPAAEPLTANTPPENAPGPALTEVPATPPPAAVDSDPPPSFPTPTASQLEQSEAALATAAVDPTPPPSSPPALPVPEIAPAAPGPTHAPAEPVAAAESMPDFESLPFATRQAIPALKVSLFVFHQDPNRRFVIVNGARLQEGGVVGEETWLREIRQDGVVFEFRGERFLLRRQGF